MEEQKWTSEPPTVEGFYFLCIGTNITIANIEKGEFDNAEGAKMVLKANGAKWLPVTMPPFPVASNE